MSFTKGQLFEAFGYLATNEGMSASAFKKMKKAEQVGFIEGVLREIGELGSTKSLDDFVGDYSPSQIKGVSDVLAIQRMGDYQAADAVGMTDEVDLFAGADEFYQQNQGMFEEIADRARDPQRPSGFTHESKVFSRLHRDRSYVQPAVNAGGRALGYQHQIGQPPGSPEAEAFLDWRQEEGSRIIQSKADARKQKAIAAAEKALDERLAAAPPVSDVIEDGLDEGLYEEPPDWDVLDEERAAADAGEEALEESIQFAEEGIDQPPPPSADDVISDPDGNMWRQDADGNLVPFESAADEVQPAAAGAVDEADNVLAGLIDDAPVSGSLDDLARGAAVGGAGAAAVGGAGRTDRISGGGGPGVMKGVRPGNELARVRNPAYGGPVAPGRELAPFRGLATVPKGPGLGSRAWSGAKAFGRGTMKFAARAAWPLGLAMGAYEVGRLMSEPSTPEPEGWDDRYATAYANEAINSAAPSFVYNKTARDMAVRGMRDMEALSTRMQSETTGGSKSRELEMLVTGAEMSLRAASQATAPTTDELLVRGGM